MGRLQTYRTAHNHALSRIPTIYLDVVHMSKRDGILHANADLKAYPFKMYGDRRIYKWCSELWKLRLSDLIAFHEQRHSVENKQCATEHVVLSVDDVPTDRSSGISMTVVCLL